MALYARCRCGLAIMSMIDDPPGHDIWLHEDIDGDAHEAEPVERYATYEEWMADNPT